MAKLGVQVRGVREFAFGLIGSRLGMAIAALIVVAFGAHAAAAPDRFPPVGTVGLSQLGLLPPPPSRPEVALTLPDDLAQYEAEVRGAARDAAQAAVGAARPAVLEAVQDYLAANPRLIGPLNAAFASVGLLLLVLAITLCARRMRRSG